VEAVGAAAIGRLGRVGEERVARARAHALAEAIGHARGQDVPRRRREAHQRPHQRRDAIAEDGQGLPAIEPIGEAPRHQLEQRRRRLGRALDGADEGARRVQHVRQEQRQ
jgi:hypothetical protein